MIEGWHRQEYLVLFDECESVDLSRRYGINNFIGGHQTIGLLGWDDFIVAASIGGLFTIPTVPLDESYLTPLGFTIDTNQLQADERYRGKIKWYVKPLVFGGNASAADNMTWISLEQHVELVKWWNKLYRSMNQQH